MASRRREEERKQERKRGRESAADWANDQNRGGRTALVLPDGVEMFKPEPGPKGKAATHRVDFMPFLAGASNPKCAQGDETFRRTYALHWLPTPSGKNAPWCCLWEVFERDCPICQWVNDNLGDANQKKMIASIKAKIRHLWVINDKPGDKANALKVYETNDWNNGHGFRELMTDAILLKSGNENFYMLDKSGLTAILSVKRIPGGEGYSAHDGVTSISFEKREYVYPDSLVEKAPCLDDMLVPAMPQSLASRVAAGKMKVSDFGDKEWRLCYDELRSKFAAAPSGDEEPRKPSSQGVDTDDEDDEDSELESSKNGKAKESAKAQPDDDDDDDSELEDTVDTKAPSEIKVGDTVVHEKHGTCEVLKIKGEKMRIEDEDGEEFVVAIGDVELTGDAKDDDDDDEDSEIDDEDEDDSDLDDEDEDDSDLDDEDEEEKKPAGKKSSGKKTK